MPAEPIATLSYRDYLDRKAEFPNDTHTITITPGDEPDLSDATFKIYCTEDLAAAHKKTPAELKEGLAKRLALADNTFGRTLPKPPSRGAKKYTEYALVAIGVLGNLFIIYTLDIEATAFLMNDNQPMEAHTAFREKPEAFGLGSAVGVLGTIPIAAFQAGFGAAVTSLPPAIVVATAIPGASSALLHCYNALSTFKRLFGEDFYASPYAIPLKGFFGATGLVSAWTGNVGFFVNDLIAQNGPIRQQLMFQMDSVARGFRTAGSLAKAIPCYPYDRCHDAPFRFQSAFSEPRALAHSPGYIAVDDDGAAPALGAADITLAKNRLDHLVRQINLLILLAEVYIPDAALIELMDRAKQLISREKSLEKLNFEELQALLHELGKLFSQYDDKRGQLLSFLGNLPTQAGSYALGYYGAIAFMPNAFEFLDEILEACGIDPDADNISELSGFVVCLGWMINLALQGLTLPSNLFRPIIRAVFAQDHLIKRGGVSLGVLIPSAAVAYNMLGLISQTHDVSNNFKTILLSMLANLNITAGISGLVQEKIFKRPEPLAVFKSGVIRINRSLQTMREALETGQLDDDEAACLAEEIGKCLAEFKGRALAPTAASTHGVDTHVACASATAVAGGEAKTARRDGEAFGGTDRHRGAGGRSSSVDHDGIRVVDVCKLSEVRSRFNRVGYDQREASKTFCGAVCSSVGSFFRRLCYDPYERADMSLYQTPAPSSPGSRGGGK